jgi:hypothetical protein
MMCPNCRKLRHDGHCDPVYEDEPDDLEMLRTDAEMAVHRYRAERNKQKAANEPR